MPDKSIFSEFNNLYSLTKTLRFELKPTPETRKFMEHKYSKGRFEGFNPIEADQKIDKLYHEEMKPMYDDLHLKFITQSLQNVYFITEDLNEFEKTYLYIKELSKNKKDYQKEIKNSDKILESLSSRLRKQVTESYTKTAKEWKEKYSTIKLKKNNYEILTEKDSLLLLKEDYPDKSEIIDKFIGFHGYFTGFNQNRENYYKDKGKATEIAFRIIDQNLVRFIENRESLKAIIGLRGKTESKDFVDFCDQVEELLQAGFDLENYQSFLIQEDIDNFNEKVVGDLNSKINLLSQRHKIKTPKLKVLYKQIGSEKKSIEILEIKQGEEWLRLQELVGNQNNFLPGIKKCLDNFFENIGGYDLYEIYFNKVSLNTISSRWFGNWQTLAQKLKESKALKTDKGEIKLKDISLYSIKEALENVENQSPESIFKLGYKGDHEIYQNECFVEGDLWQTFLNIWRFELDKNFAEVDKLVVEFETKKNKEFEKKVDAKWLKQICDSFLNLERMLKYNKRKEEGGDANFYEEIDKYLSGDGSQLFKYYNAFRNYISKKPFETDKVKLNFENASLLDGWDINKESDNTCSIFRRGGGSYYLAIMKDKHILSKVKNPKLYEIDNHQNWEKMEYKFFPEVSKMIPKCSTQTKKVKKHFEVSDRDFILNNKNFNSPLTITKEVYDLNNILFDKNDLEEIAEDSKNGVKRFQKGYLDNGGDESIYYNSLKIWIDFCINFLNKYKSCEYFDYSKLESSDEYRVLDDFYKDVNKYSYYCNFININENILHNLIAMEKLYIFEIYNKDFSTNKKKGSRVNLETIYFKNLFSEANSKNNTLKLNGQAEVFWRKGQKDKLYKKIDNQGKEIVDAKRYAEDKIFLHFPITINFDKNDLSVKDFNAKVDTIDSYDLSYLGIDRGEKHLIYYSLIDSSGNIIKQGSFNKIKMGDKLVDFHDKLTQRAENMMEARKNWETIGNIKNFKEGYLSQVVHEIYQLVLEHNALIIMEDLNSEFKAKRTAKVEKSVYKKFELALAKKLNHLVLKDRELEEKGGVLHGYQLTPYIGAGEVGNFEKAREWGIIKYVRAAYTSTTDPLTGWRKRKYIRNSETIDKIKEFFNPDTGVQIDWSNKHSCFKFSYDWESGIGNNKESGRDEIFAFEGLERFRWNPKYQNSDKTMGKIEKYDLYEKFTDLFSDFNKSRNINQQIFELGDFKWKNLVFYWNLLNQIRNTDRAGDTDNTKDFIQSPAYSKEIQGFYDSRKADYYRQKFGTVLPENGDANGAYHIAKRGLELRK